MYSFWYFFKAKNFQPLTLDNLALTWKIHKQQTKCKAAYIHTLIVKNHNVVGFKFQCGSKYLAKRQITQRTHNFRGTAELSAKITSLQKTTSTLQNLGIQYLKIKQL